MPLLIATISSALALSAGAGAVDRTVSCQVPAQAGIPILTLRASPTSKNSLIAAGLWAYANDRNGNGGVALLGVANVQNGYAAPAAGWCVAAPRIPLAHDGIPREGVYPKYSDGLGQGIGSRCMTAGRVTIRLRATIVGATPVAAQLAVRSGKRQRPVAYVDWTPKRVTTYLTDDCQS
jgi:hypothetical protein